MNGALTNVVRLDHLSSTGGGLAIGGNESLSTLRGLDNLTIIGSDLQIGLELTGGFNFQGNPLLTSLTRIGRT